MTIKDAILAYIGASASGVADSDLRQALSVKHHAQVNQRCRELAAAGLIERRQEETGIRNYFVALPRRNLKSRPPVISDQAWFWEGNVQAAVVRHLVQDGFNVVRVADTSSREHGKDIVVRKDGREVWVSVKGRPAGTERTTPFTQARNWFYGVFFEVCRLARRRLHGRPNARLTGIHHLSEPLGTGVLARRDRELFPRLGAGR